MALDMAKRNELKEWVRRAEGLDAEQKSALLGLLSEYKRYGLVWEEKPARQIITCMRNKTKVPSMADLGVQQ